MIEGKRYYVLPISKITIRKDVIDNPRWWKIIILKKVTSTYTFDFPSFILQLTGQATIYLGTFLSRYKVILRLIGNHRHLMNHLWIMSRSNEAFQSTASLHPSSSASNKESSEVINVGLPPSYASVTSQYNDDLQPSQSEVLSNDVK